MYVDLITHRYDIKNIYKELLGENLIIVKSYVDCGHHIIIKVINEDQLTQVIDMLISKGIYVEINQRLKATKLRKWRYGV